MEDDKEGNIYILNKHSLYLFNILNRESLNSDVNSTKQTITFTLTRCTQKRGITIYDVGNPGLGQTQRCGEV